MRQAAAGSAVERVNWDDVRLLLQIARSGSFRAAADAVQMSANTLRRRLSVLEAEIGHILVERGANGISLTRTGAEVAEIAKRMSGQLSDLDRLAHDQRRGVLGTVRVAASDRLGLGWITPQLMNVGQERPDATFELWCGVRFFDGPSVESDIWIQLERPTSQELVAARLGFLHLELFASNKYIETFGAPTDTGDLARFHIIEQVSDEVPLLSEMLPNPEHRRFVSLRVSTSGANAHAVASGAGIGLMPTYAPTLMPNLRAINCGFHVRHEIWMSYHPRVRQTKPVRAAIDGIKDAFDPVRRPWFRELYIPAEELRAA